MPEATEIVYSIQDDDGHQSTMSVRVPSTTLHSDVVAFADDVATLIDAVIDGFITRIGISTNVALPGGLKTAALLQAKVEQGATFIYTSAAGFLFRHRIPTFKYTLIDIGGNTVDQADPAVSPLIAAMENGLTPVATLVEPCEHRDDDLTDISTAVQTYTKTRG